MTQYPAQLLTNFRSASVEQPYGPSGSGLCIARYFVNVLCSAKMSAMACEGMNSINPVSPPVANTRNGVNFKSRFSLFSNRSMREIICTHN